MMRYVKTLFTLLTFICFSITSLYAMQDGQATVTITVEDDYTNEPVEAVLVRLLDNGSEIASGTTDLSGRAELVLNVTSTEETSNLIPESFQVSKSYPNPFKQSSSVNLQIDEAQEVQAEIYNIIGQRVASLQVNLTPGTYTLQSSLGHLAQGVYFLRILGTQSQTIKMTKVGERIFSGGSILNINPATFVTRNGPGMAGLTLKGQIRRSLTLVTSNSSYDTYQQSIQIAADTTIAVEMSRNNQVIIRVADENSPTQDVETNLLIEGDQFSQQITSPDTLSLKSGFYTLSADEDNTMAFSKDVEIASEDQTVTVLTQVKTLADDQLQLEGMITDESSGNPIDRAYIYLLNQTTSDTLAGPLFAGSDGVLDVIANLNNGPDLDLSILYRKAGYTDFESTTSVSLPDTLNLATTLQPAQSPTASFTVSGDQNINTPLIFDASASVGAAGEDLNYSWDFGNGKRGFGQVISFVYADNGSYDVTLTVAGEYGSTNNQTETLNISRSPFSPPTTVINGEITTIDQKPLEGVTAQVVNNELESVSGTDGRIIIPDIPVRGPIVVKLTLDGYATQTVRFRPDEDSGENFFTVSMIPLEKPVVVPSIEAGTYMTGKFGTRVRLPVDALVDANGDVVTGDVELSMTPLDISSDEIFAFPGGFDGLRPTGELGSLISFGVADFTFTQNGETLQMMPGKLAEIEIPVTNADLQLGDIIPLWTLDEETGLWIEEGTGEIITSSDSPSGLAMITTTGHFSWKNIDVFQGGSGIGSPGSYTLIPSCINSETGLNVTCSINGKSVNEDGTIAGYAPTVVVPKTGETRLLVPLNKTFELSAVSNDGLLSGSESVAPVSNANDEVSVTIDLTSRSVSEEITIAYGDFLKGRATLSEVSRYVFEGTEGDYIKIRVREGIGFEGNGIIYLRDWDDNILQEGGYANNFSRYLFEDLPATGTYYIDVESETDVSNFDIELDLFTGPVNREISYGERIFDFLWPGTTNTYTFEGQTDEVFELMARNVEGEGSLLANLKLNTTNPLVSYETQFFDNNVWVKRLEEKDGTYSFEVSGASDSRYGEYILDFNTVNNFNGTGAEIAYGDSILGKVTESEPTNSFTFEGSAGDFIRFHFDKPYPDESDNRIVLGAKIYSSDSTLLYESRQYSFRRLTDFGSGFILQSDDVYTITIEASNINSFEETIASTEAEGELYSLILENFENPTTKDLEDDNIDVTNNEVFATGLNMNAYNFNGSGADLARLSVRATDGTNGNRGLIQVYDENNQLLFEDIYTSGRFGIKSLIDIPLSDQQYKVVVLNILRIKESFGRIAYGILFGKGDLTTFDSVNSLELPPDEGENFFFENDTPGTEISVSVVGYDTSSPTVGLADPEGSSVNLFFSRAQSYIPTVLEAQGNYSIGTTNRSNSAKSVDLTVVKLQPSDIFQLSSDDVVSLNGSIRLGGDIERFDFSPDSDGVITLSLLPVEANSIDDSGELRIQLREPAFSGLIQASSEDVSPAGDELYIWEGAVNAQDDYRIHIYDQKSITSGEFILEITFTPDP